MPSIPFLSSPRVRRLCAPLLALAMGTLASGCFVDTEYSDETIIEFEACQTFHQYCDSITHYRVYAREIDEDAVAERGERIQFRDLTPNRLYTFDIEGFSGDEPYLLARCEIGAVPYSITEADCREHVRYAK